MVWRFVPCYGSFGSFGTMVWEVCTMLGEFWYNGMEVCTMLGEFCTMVLYHVRGVLVQWYGGLYHVRGGLWYNGTMIWRFVPC